MRGRAVFSRDVSVAIVRFLLPSRLSLLSGFDRIRRISRDRGAGFDR